jgi:crotonobetainyl-CoA:carnitine CoA-transferase CaiB-like acyl-CoA transferase
MGEPIWLEDPRFKDDISRGDNGALISERMQHWCAARTTTDALEILGRENIPAAPVLTPQQALDDPQAAAMGLFRHVDYPGLPRPAPVARVPVWLSETPGTLRHRPPMLGEHTEQILGALGYDEVAIAELRRKGVV